MEKQNSGFGTAQNAINRAGSFGQQLEDLIVKSKIKFRSDRDDLLMAYWSLVFDYAKGIHCLLNCKFYSAAAALIRPAFEAATLAGKSLVGSEQDIARIRKGRYKVNYEKDGKEIDDAIGHGEVFEPMLKKNRGVLHSFTHSGTLQLHRRFDGNSIGANFSEKEIAGLAGASFAATFLATILVASHFGLKKELEEANELFMKYEGSSRHSPDSPASDFV
jgi:hypothetical protein